jgi:hypothetical protein
MLSHPGVQPRDLEKEGEGKRKKKKKKKHFFSDDDFLDFFFLSTRPGGGRAADGAQRRRRPSSWQRTTRCRNNARTSSQATEGKREKEKKSKNLLFFLLFFLSLVSVFAEQCAHWLSRRSNNISLLRLLRAGAQNSHLNSKLNSQVRLLFVAPHRQQRCCVTRLTLFSFLVVYHSTSTNRMFGLRPHFHLGIWKVKFLTLTNVGVYFLTEREVDGSARDRRRKRPHTAFTQSKTCSTAAAVAVAAPAALVTACRAAPPPT